MAKPSKKPYIFIFHRSKDEEIINLIEVNFENNRIDKVPYFARRYIAGRNPADKVIETMKDSVALFVIITNNVVNDLDTLNWVLFEMGLAKGREIPVYGWKDSNVEEVKVPVPIKYITDYDTFNLYDEEDLLRIVGVMMNLAIEL
jgi:hypothetical protein